MGWTSFPMHEPVREWFRKEWEFDTSKYEVLDSALVKRSTLYGAIKNKATGEVFCAVFLIRWSRDHYNFSYKDMTEFAGPNESECPQRIMKLLSPLNDENDPNGWARAWRKRCEENYQKREAVKKAKGSIIKTKDPISFTNGCSYQFFKKTGRTLWAGRMIDDEFRMTARVRLNISRFEFEIV